MEKFYSNLLDAHDFLVRKSKWGDGNGRTFVLGQFFQLFQIYGKLMAKCSGHLFYLILWSQDYNNLYWKNGNMDHPLSGIGWPNFWPNFIHILLAHKHMTFW
jgi:hypothetical protein